MATGLEEEKGESLLSYEDLRKRKLEENKRKLEELNLGRLSREALLTPKTSSPAKGVKRKVPADWASVIPIRRSGRVAGQPSPNYKETPVLYEVVNRPRRIFHGRSSHRDLSGRVYASDEARMYAFTKAEEIQSGLDSDIPSFVKPMTQSHVTGGFWLGLPTHFCRDYLPKSDTLMTLIDEQGEISENLYLAQKRGLSAGWRGFAIMHELVDGDAVVFQLIKPTTFKIYIVRASGYQSS